MKKLTFALAVASLATSLSARAGVIEAPTEKGGSQLNAYEPMGQSFIAQDAYIKFAFSFVPFNPPYANTPIQISLVAGEGVNGTVLNSQTFSLAGDCNGCHDIDFSSVALTVGQSYTAFLGVPGDSPYWGVRFSDDSYAGGTGYRAGKPSATISCSA